MKKLIAKLQNFIIIVIIHLFNCLPIKNNKIFFFSYYGSQYGCNPKYITEYILDNYPENTFDIVWAFTESERKNVPEDIRKVRVMTLKYFYELCTSKVIVTNFRTTDYFIKRKNQYYIQTWHSSLRLKQIEKDAEESLPAHYLEMAKNDSKKCDLLLSGCKFSSDIFKRAFWYNGEIFESGTPRNDVLVNSNPELRKQIFKRLNVNGDKKIILYAPTFRNSSNLDIYKMDYSSIIKELHSRFGGEWLFFIKLHPHLASRSKEILQGENNVIDASSYDDIQELLSIADVLLTDYSSLMFDYAITKRPCFLYVPDIKEYTAKERGLYFNITGLPFFHSTDQSNLRDQIRKFNEEKYQLGLDRFSLQTGSFENGKACERLVKRIEVQCYPEKEEDVYEAV
ncbi:CDP-glycerol glycerophosphotransferase family protein [Evansella clarkii]|uniref:CDP-glycerol glycerophosphotransferase family protein n=1 Tax=Evansella clarkii TaxID=79879 RepID=UPI000997C947|nr:CDP-glycerol glycerophosphotransferase family protein [Evansella clarkii]